MFANRRDRVWFVLPSFRHPLNYQRSCVQVFPKLTPSIHRKLSIHCLSPKQKPLFIHNGICGKKRNVNQTIEFGKETSPHTNTLPCENTTPSGGPTQRHFVLDKQTAHERSLWETRGVALRLMQCFFFAHFPFKGVHRLGPLPYIIQEIYLKSRNSIHLAYAFFLLETERDTMRLEHGNISGMHEITCAKFSPI